MPEMLSPLPCPRCPGHFLSDTPDGLLAWASAGRPAAYGQSRWGWPMIGVALPGRPPLA